MDTSEIYIKMCREAKEIQIAWNRKEGDFFLSLIDKYCGYPIRENGCLGQTILEDTPLIWLPRQDQLQEMAKGFKQYWESANETDDLIQNFHEWFEEDCFRENDFNVNSYSMEQLWLCLVMNSKYKKRWDKEKETWIPYKDQYHVKLGKVTAE